VLISALHHAFRGLHLHQERFARHADAVARWGSTTAAHEPAVASRGTGDSAVQPLLAPGPAADPVRDLTGLLLARRGWEANLAVLRSADTMLGTLIDRLA
jgi:hypothetical protein